MVAPITKWVTEPDVVIVIANPYNGMRITQGYAYHYGMPESIRMIGNQAICLECTARPYVTKDMNMSLLCIGTRHRAHWGNDEMAVGIPIERFYGVIDGLIQTANTMESNDNKEKIIKRLKENNLVLELHLNDNYYKKV